MKRRLLCLLVLCCLPLLPGRAAAPGSPLLHEHVAGLDTDSDTPPPWPTVTRSRFRSNAVAPAAGADGLPIVRLGYVIPSNRAAQADAVAKIRALVLDSQRWYRDQMDQQGYGPKTFRLETEADGVTPMVHVVTVTETDDYLRVDPWSRTNTAAQNAGLTLWTSGEVWVLVPEIHLQAADGSMQGAGVSLGASNGSGSDPGVAMISGDLLAVCRPGFFTNDAAYNGVTVPEVGPYPLKYGSTYPSYAGTTFSAICSSSRGAITHEMSHAFGLPHDFRNDANFHGNLMGNGLRGFRGAFTPARYPSDYTRLSTAAAGMLNTSRYFNPVPAGSTSSPSLSVSTSGAVTPVGGLLPIAFSASAPAGLSWAWLTLEGNLVSELPLTGTSVSTQFNVPNYTKGSTNNFTVFVFDRWGNRQSASTAITPNSQAAQAPQPYVKITPPVPLFGESVTLDASASTDPAFAGTQLRFEWDLQGNGNFVAATASALKFTPVLAGNSVVRLRITNPVNLKSVSTPVALHTHSPLLSLTANPGGTSLTWLSKAGFVYQLQRSLDLRTWTTDSSALFTGDGSALRHDDAAGVAPFQRLQISRAGN